MTLDPETLGGFITAQVSVRVASAAPSESRFWSRPDGQVHVQHSRPSSSISFAPHTHSEYNIVVCLSGAVSKTQLGVTQIIETGETMIGNFGVEHASAYLAGPTGCEAVSLTLDRRILSDILRGSHLPLSPDHRQPVFLGKIQSAPLFETALNLVDELCAPRFGSDIVVEALASQMLVESVRAWPKAGVELLDVDFTPRLPRRDFVKACEFMRWCRKDSFRLNNLCRFLGTSEERFTRLFRASVNDSPASFYNRMLLERACDLLLNPDLSVKEIGYELGFKTSSHFVAAFRRLFGRTPIEHRLMAAFPSHVQRFG